MSDFTVLDGITVDDIPVKFHSEDILTDSFEVDPTLTVSGAAADAKVTGDKLGALEEGLDYILSVSMTNGGLISYANGEVVSNNDCAYTNYVPVIGGTVVKLSNIWVTGTRSVCLYNADKTYVYTQIADSSATSVEFAVPFDICFIRATAHKNYTVEAKYVDMQPVTAGRIQKEKNINAEYTTLLPINENLINPISAICSHSSGRAWGFSFTKSYNSVAYLPYFTNNNLQRLLTGTYILDRCKQSNGIITEVISSEAHKFTDVLYFTNVTTDDFFIIKSTFSSGTRVFLGYATTANVKFTTALGYITGDSQGASITSLTVGSVSGEFLDISPIWNKWKGKTGLFLGDSITDLGVYSDPLSYMLGLGKAYNRGVSGNTVANIGTGTSFCERVDLTQSDADTHSNGMPTTADIVFVFGGVNDWGKRLSSGEVIGTVTAAPNTTDFCGSLKYVYEALKEMYPTARIVSIIPYRLYSDYMPVFSEMRYVDDDEEKQMNFVNYSGNTFDSYRTAIKTISSYYGIDTIDLLGCGFSFFRSDDRELYAKETEETGSAHYDGIHPNSAGGFKMAQYIYSKVIAM